MRLIQIARELGVTQNEIIVFLEGQKLANNLNPHIKIDANILEKVWEEFDFDGKIREEKALARKTKSMVIEDSPNELESSAENSSELLEPTDQGNVIEDELEDSTQIDIIENELEDHTHSEMKSIELSTEQIEVSDEKINEESSLLDHIDTVSDEKARLDTETEELSHENSVEDSVNQDQNDTLQTDDVIEEEISLPEVNEVYESTLPKDEETIALTTERTEVTVEQLLEEESIDPNEEAIIRAKLVKLEGIKVIGKIELPPPPKPKENAEKPSRKPQHKDRTRKKHQKRRGELSYTDKLARDEKRKEKEKLKKEQEAKAKKKQHYEGKISKSPVSKSAKPSNGKTKVKKKNIQQSTEKKVSKNPISKLWGWLNGRYDSY